VSPSASLNCAAEPEAQIREAIAFHLDGLREGGLAVPEPTSKVESIELTA